MAKFSFQAGAEVDILSGEEFHDGMSRLERAVSRRLPVRHPVFSDGVNLAYTAPDNAAGFILRCQNKPSSGRLWCVRSILLYNTANTAPPSATGVYSYLCVGSSDAPTIFDARAQLQNIPASQTFTSTSVVVGHQQDLYVIILGTNANIGTAFNCEVDDYPEDCLLAQGL